MASKMTSLLTAAALTTLAAAPSAIAHEGNGDERYHSQVRRVMPAGFPVAATTQNQRFERLQIRNLGSGTITVLDYEGKPYARVTREKVLLNIAQGEAKPDWRVFESKPEFAYHDHRAHWMANEPPRTVDENSTKPQRIMRWKVPILYDGKSGTIEGDVYYLPASQSAQLPHAEPTGLTAARLLVVALGTSLTVASLLFVYLRRARRVSAGR